MLKLTPITALGGTEPRVDTIKGVTLTENPGLALASVAARLGHEETCRKHLSDLLEAPAPTAGKSKLHDPEAAFWTGPDQWMVGAPFDTHEDLATQLKQRFGDTASITEQTDAWACFDLRGDGIEAVIELCCNINIRAMKTEDATRTSIHHLGCFILRRDPANWVRILGPRASAGSLHHALLTAMKSAL
ncbi:sarcosine oxidase subunit gamma [Sulfitobacter donghicola]|uniref:Sarcosine oxidase n=1 Tax=Sulfitobacter donghicola DSW-25 = KCTC 12864 = JCM 14565 TaxID=1300350 RepID=A0A073IF86_9RHOB|nr:sarcosine oxidase subunit gamma [Sulfitobacter donghicola]KEJ88156.1 sarcosine oxidase [Sulfitobacter donghicola DSW-25 = KCTC 12864 = JCM 14565]KIN70092.1 Sarcosine oxidase, gamma subunit [Sulfitobacter donghicola DSW-25 = KCTC 12864 = JCM 14565]